ncbi:MAG: C40 family peptidase [Bacteroidaceae bacterium]|nr:C40 family peptidase [Bacteroidaceae bacterium]
MKRLFLLLFIFATTINASQPRRHEVKIKYPDQLPMPAPVSFVVEVPEVIIPAMSETLIRSEYGTTGELLVRTAKKYLGCGYGAGQRGPNRFDCSGLTSWVYETEGIEISRSSRSQYMEGVAVTAEELQPGDLVFFARGSDPGSIYHVGMVVEADGRGGFKFIHSANTGVCVTSSSDAYYARHYYGARRILAAPGDRCFSPEE